MATTLPTIITILSITVQSQPGSRTTSCSDWKECYNSTQAITNTNVNCNGEQSCALSSITTPRARTGYIKCSAHWACYQIELLALGRKDIYCSAHEACGYSRTITAQNLYCTGSESCLTNLYTDSRGISATNDIVCGGYQSCYAGAQMTASGSVKCSGYGSCERRPITAEGHIRCSGEYSCRWATLQTEKTVYCTGKEACLHAVIRAGVVILSGSTTIESAIIDTPLIEAYGANSIRRNSVIDSGSLSAMTVRLSGTRKISDKAYVICRSGAVCDLFCASTACRNIVYQCESGATCNVSPTNCASNPGASVDGIQCPGFRIIRSTMTEDMEYDDGDDKALDIVEKEDDDGIDSNDIINCVTESECASQVFTGQDRIFCQGLSSCESALFPPLSTLYCYAESACYGANFNGTSLSVCRGENSCKDAVRMQIAWGVYCEGFESCAGNNIEGKQGHVRCDGVGACQDTNIALSDGSSVSCMAENSCQNSVVTGGRVQIYCSGLNSCKGATLTTSYIDRGRNVYDAIYCSGASSCKDAIIFLTAFISTIEIGGYLAATGATINTQGNTVLVRGYQGLAYGTIDSEGGSDLDIILHGAQAMYGGTLICRNASICNLICKGNSCENMDYLCESGATCNVEPSKCSSGRRIVFNNNICPTITNTVANTDIEGFLERKKMDREDDEVYVKIEEYILMNEEKSEEYIFDVNNYDVDNVIIDEVLSFGEVGVVENVLSFKGNQMVFLALVGISVLIVSILSFYKMILRNKEYEQLE